jgi:hypothetical protein
LFFARRLDAPNKRVANDDLVQTANDWLAARQLGFTPITAKALVAATIAHGNIPFGEPPWPSLGLGYGSRSEAQPSAWRKVLEAGRLPDGLPARPLDDSIGTQPRSSAI